MKLMAHVLCTNDGLQLDHGVVLMSSWMNGEGLLMGGLGCHLVESSSSRPVSFKHILRAHRIFT